MSFHSIEVAAFKACHLVWFLYYDVFGTPVHSGCVQKKLSKNYIDFKNYLKLQIEISSFTLAYKFGL